jgi:hypothetical protein
MNKPADTRPKTHTVTILALLGIFLAAALLALAGRMLPGRIGRIIRKRAGRATGAQD